MEASILEQVCAAYHTYDFAAFTDADVRAALEKERLTAADYAALLSPAAQGRLEEMAHKAQTLTRAHFGNAALLMTPLYLANYCVNACVYCGYNCHNKIRRAKLTYDEMRTEYEHIARAGLREILLLTGESRAQSDVTYIGKAIALAKSYFTTIGIEIYPVDTQEYAYLHEQGADFVSIYQETYDTALYDEVHPSGPKKDFAYRFNGQERALQAGFRGAGFGALLGLGDFRRDAFAAGLHAALLAKKYPQAELSFSVPRLRPFKNSADTSPRDVHETQLFQVMLAYRLWMPYAGITISARERAGFRDHVVGVAATKLSASVRTTVGGHDEAEKGDEQFEIADARSLAEIETTLRARGLQPIYADHIRL